jgi:hypothetical protein
MDTFAETAIVDSVYRLPTKGKKLMFSVSVWSKQTEVCHFCFHFLRTNKSYYFLLVQFSGNICICAAVSVHTHIWKTVLSIQYIYHRYICCYFKLKTEARVVSIICLPFNQCPSEVCHLSVCWRRNKWKWSVCKQTKWTERIHLSMPFNIVLVTPLQRKR